MVAYVESGQGAVVMTNGDQGGRLASELLRAIAAEYRLARLPSAEEKTVASLPRRSSRGMPGATSCVPATWSPSLSGMASSFSSIGSSRIELLPESSTKFFELVEESEIEFLKGPDGTATGALVNGQVKARRLAPSLEPNPSSRAEPLSLELEPSSPGLSPEP